MVNSGLRDSLKPELSQNIDKERRKFAKALAAGVAFVVPFMASFSMDGLEFSIGEAQAAKKKAKRKATKKKATKKKAKRKATKKKAKRKTKKKATKRKATKKKAKRKTKRRAKKK